MASSPAVLKQQAAALELKKQPEKALALYQQLLAEHGGTDDVDVALRNRVGDLHLRVGQVDEAIALFEKSADEYALSGFLNNAIALCNKILRQRPGHVPTLRRLARFSAEKGMVVDAQRHYLSVAEALEKLGQHGEALKALSEFAELSPDDVHVRSVVVEQLLRAGRKPDALPHLTVLHRLHVLAGRHDEAEGVAQVAREMDEHWMPESDQEIARKRTDPSLVFIDSDDDFGALEIQPMLSEDRSSSAPPVALEGLELTSVPSPLDLASVQPGSTLDGFESTSFGGPEDVPPEESQEPPSPPRGTEVAPESMFDDVFGDAPEPSGSVDFLEIAPATQHDELPLVASLTPFDLPAIVPDAPAPPAVSRSAPDDGHDLLDEIPSFGTVETVSNAHNLPGTYETAAPVDTEALVASLLPDPEPTPPPVAAIPEPPPRPKRPTPTYVNLADILRDDEPETSRMTIGEPQQTGDHDGDFEHILQEFRDGIEKTIPMEDVESHFDLGIAFREMGLLDDAIAEFQIASRSREKRVESIEALGGCFLDKREPGVARTLLLRALEEPSAKQNDDRLRGVLYLLGLASEALGAREDGLRYYQRVYAVDIRFRDVASRIQTLQQPA
ncbi:MAG: tetratricopeptide repeat protein [Gemmatimonadaceae bacterium]|nr:tetratricopeptide repeat protein [Gemmatimonadaceae bacterium]